jgi:thymidylate kinase
MAETVEYPGRLIAIDGTRGKDNTAAADALIAALRDKRVECAVSGFDASGLFGELAAAGRDGNISARSLSLVYAADLAFRLRWEIRPVLEGGGVVIATPYIETAVAIGAAHGLEEEWLRELLRFAPKPHFRARVEEKKIDKRWKARLNRGYGEYCAAMLAAGSKAKAAPAREEALAFLQRPRGRKVYRLAGHGVADLAKAITGSLRAARNQPASRPRSARK